MPHRVLQIVAGLIGLAAVSAFAMGVVSAPQRGGRLPGEKAGAGGGAAAIQAADATPLGDERIEGPPEPTPEEIAKAKAEAEAAAKKKAEEAAAREAEEEQARESAVAGNVAAPIAPLPAGNAQAPAANAPTGDEPPF